MSYERSGSRNPNWRGGIVKKDCKQCGEGFEVKPGRARIARFCSLPCANEWQALNPYPRQLLLPLVLRSSGKYPACWQRIRNRIVERDGGVCRSLFCWRPEETRVHVHHIDFDTQNCSDENLITVCVSCNHRAGCDRIMWQAMLSAWNRWRIRTGNFDANRRGWVTVNQRMAA